MADFEINIYLSNGGKATLKLENQKMNAADEIELSIQSGMLLQSDIFRFTSPGVIISLKKNEIIGYSIALLDQLP